MPPDDSSQQAKPTESAIGPSSGVAGESWEQLTAHIRDLGSVVVAFSGGVDSSLLLAAAHDALGDRALAVTARSATYPAHELEQAIAIAGQIGVRHRIIDSNEMEDPGYSANPPDRCYYCKRELFQILQSIASREGFACVIDGTNHDDRLDVRPGRRAAREMGVRSPLAELGFGKNLVRQLSRERGLPNWDDPACACLASRIPYNQPITQERLRRIEGAEAEIRALGFRLVRVRDYGDVARIEVDAEEMDNALKEEVRLLLVQLCRRHGFLYVCLDLEGYRTGSMNEILALTPEEA